MEVIVSAIRIIKVPEGFAPPDIREAWVGIEISLAEHPSGVDDPNKYCVSRPAGAQALRIAGKHAAAQFWSGHDQIGQYLLFNKSECEYLA